MTEMQMRRILMASLVSLAIHLSGGAIILQFIKTLAVIRPPQPLEFSLVAPEVSRVPPPPVPKPSVSRPRPLPKPVIPVLPPVLEPPKASSEMENKVETEEPPVPELTKPLTDSQNVLEQTREIMQETPPSFDADYLKNPVPEYPFAARRLGLQGTVIVRVLVNPNGRAERVLLEKSSGAQILDDAALRAVERWLFVPARRGNQQISAWVDVPVRFRLN